MLKVLVAFKEAASPEARLAACLFLSGSRISMD